MDANGNGNAGVTYAEIRQWAVWLRVLTPSDLANAMGVHYDIGRKGVKALLWHGIFEDTGDEIDGPDGPEPIISYVPVPPGPTHHPTEVPEWRRTPGCYELAQATGMPVRIRTERQQRGLMSTPGARQKVKNRERAWERQQKAGRDRAEKQRLKAKAA